MAGARDAQKLSGREAEVSDHLNGGRIAARSS